MKILGPLGLRRRGRRHDRAVGATLGAALVAAVVAVAPLASVGASALTSSRPAVDHLPNVLDGLSLAERLGTTPPSTPMDLLVTLAHPDTAGELAAYTAMYDPSSPDYHKFLTPAEYATEFGVPAATVAATESWLRSGGMRIESVSGAGDAIVVGATARSASRLFDTPIRSYRFKGRDFYANTAAPAYPASLPVTTILGLNTLQAFQPADSGVPAASPPAAASPAVAASPAQSGGTFTGTFVPQDLWKIYDMPNSDMGQGQSIGIIGGGDIAPVIANLRIFEQRDGLPEIPVRVVHSVAGDHDLDVDGEFEWNLDSQASSGMAPKAKQLVYYFGNSLADAGIVASFAAWANDPAGPLQVGASFGECETDPLNPVVGDALLDPPNSTYGLSLGDNSELASEPILRQATLEGRTLFTASGDTGGFCAPVQLPTNTNGLLPGTAPFESFPAVSPYVVSVGGTVLQANGAADQRVSETSWTYSSGGPSAFVAEPAFQKGIAAINHPCLVDPTGQAYPSGTICRGVPDIAADSAGGIPEVSSIGTYGVVQDMSSSAGGGTSLSDQLASGMWARIQAAAPKGGLGFADESLYRAAKGPDYHRDFDDVTQSELGIGNFAYQPGPGYDYDSGLGVMDVANIMRDLDHRLTPINPALPPAVAPNPVACGRTDVYIGSLGNATDPITGQNDPALNFTGGGFSLSPDHQSLIVYMSGPGLSPGIVPTSYAGTEFFVYWTYKDMTYYAEAQASGETVVFVDGYLDPVNGPTQEHVLSGVFADGTMAITVPLTDVGSPPIGARLEYPYATTVASLTGVPLLIFVGLQTVDAGSTNDYKVGCKG